MYALMIVIAIAPIALSAAAPAEDVIPIVSQTQDGPNPDGSYKYAYESGNGIKASEEGNVANPDSDNAAMQATGEYSYRGDDGQQISVKYTANEEGFKPVGDHLPTAPPIPELIQKALDWIAAHPSKEDQNNV
ncbi:endocuticle structural glycoprotein SgAbd-4-like [Microplitis mediator]|uniref:endocuticle structural glycoprotein SgAbd-4-like n=1 Tax=Microplitis mediator TaxID=375433 RepID=UPI0025548DFA|nr:endocuticle structural glycoprotein SgAbd-4-like [Microplitis mediator]